MPVSLIVVAVIVGVVLLTALGMWINDHTT